MIATLTSLPVKQAVLDRHRSATARLQVVRAKADDLGQRNAVIESFGVDPTRELDHETKIVLATAAELLPDALIATQIELAEAERLRLAARGALLPEGLAQPGSRLWVTRTEVDRARETFNERRSQLLEARDRVGSLKRRLAAGAITDGGELVATRANIELGEPRIAAAEQETRAAERAWEAAKEREADLARHMSALRTIVASSDDVEEVERAAAEVWDILRAMSA